MVKFSVCLLMLIQLIALTLEYETRCPVTGEWRFRGKKFNCGSTQYVCLFHSLRNIHHENCNGLDYSNTGSKLVFEPFFNKALCNKNRYQPFPFSTDGSSECVYQKSFCDEKGQYVFHKGSLNSDTTCGCDLSSGYEFVFRPKHSCYCMPSEEDCSCHKLPCNDKEEQCPEDDVVIKRRSSPKKYFSLSSEDKFINTRIQYNKSRTERDVCKYCITALLIAMISCILLDGLIEWPDLFYEHEHEHELFEDLLFSKVLNFIELTKIKRETTTEDKNRKFMEILLHKEESKIDKFINVLNKYPEYKSLAYYIRNTVVTTDDRRMYVNHYSRHE